MKNKAVYVLVTLSFLSCWRSLPPLLDRRPESRPKCRSISLSAARRYRRHLHRHRRDARRASDRESGSPNVSGDLRPLDPGQEPARLGRSCCQSLRGSALPHRGLARAGRGLRPREIPRGTELASRSPKREPESSPSRPAKAAADSYARRQPECARIGLASRPSSIGPAHGP